MRRAHRNCVRDTMPRSCDGSCSHQSRGVLVGNITPVDASRVRKFSAWAQQSAAMRLPAGSNIVDINKSAWLLLRDTIRRSADHAYDNDYNAAAAEHYMFIRWVAGSSGDPMSLGAPVLYAGVKLWKQLRGTLQSDLRTSSNHPVLPTNPGVVAWGMQGVRDGLQDYKKTNHGAPFKPGTAVAGIASFSLSPANAQRAGSYAKTVGASYPR